MASFSKISTCCSPASARVTSLESSRLHKLFLKVHYQLQKPQKPWPQQASCCLDTYDQGWERWTFLSPKEKPHTHLVFFLMCVLSLSFMVILIIHGPAPQKAEVGIYSCVLILKFFLCQRTGQVAFGLWWGTVNRDWDPHSSKYSITLHGSTQQAPSTYFRTKTNTLHSCRVLMAFKNCVPQFK